MRGDDRPSISEEPRQGADLPLSVGGGSSNRTRAIALVAFCRDERVTELAERINRYPDGSNVKRVAMLQMALDEAEERGASRAKSRAERC